MIKKLVIFTATILIVVQTTAQHSKGMLSIAFEHFAGDKALKLDSAEYKNALDQSYTITKFKYYISNIVLMQESGKDQAFSGYFLIDEDEEKSKKIFLERIPQGKYKSISFLLGVDSLSNCSGAQSGALDPINGMFWVWNTGYIFLKLEGKASASTAPGKIFEYHIGGYKEPSYCIRRITIPLTESLLIKNNSSSLLKINVDATEILKNPAAIDFSKMPSVVDSKNATLLADNYSDIFTISK